MPPLNGWTTGVYQIKNRLTGQVYVGSASTSLAGRISNHRWCLEHGVHDNSYLQRAYNKYGRAAFVFSVLEKCSPALCVKREQYWMDRLGAADRSRGYNLAPTAGSMFGYRHTEADKRRIAEITKERMARPEVRANVKAGQARRVANPLLAVKVSAGLKKHYAQPGALEACRRRKQDPEYRAKLSAASKKRMNRPEVKAKTSAAFKTYWADPAHRSKLKAQITSRWADPEARARLCAGMRGKKRGPEARANMSRGKRALWDDPAAKAEMLRKRAESRARNRAARLGDGCQGELFPADE